MSLFQNIPSSLFSLDCEWKLLNQVNCGHAGGSSRLLCALTKRGYFKHYFKTFVFIR